MITQYEFYRFYYARNRHLSIFAGLILGFLLTLNIYLETFSSPWATPLILLLLAAAGSMLFSLFTVRELKAALSDSAVMFFGVVYVSLLLSYLLYLRKLPDGELLIIFILAITWLCDAGAYYVGTLMGRHSLAPRISPHKTIEGAMGGLAFSVAGSLAAKFWFLPFLTLGDSIRLGLILGVAGQLGDLVESMWKRGAGVKDSSGFLPAHGGLLDKVDSLIFTAPVFFYYLLLVKGYSPAILL